MSTAKHAITDFILSRQAKGCAPSTVYFYRRVLRPFTEMELTELTPSFVRSYLAHLTVKPHPTARVMRAFLRFASREGYLPPVSFDMPRYVRPPVRVLNDAEIRLLLSACRKPKERAAIALLLDTGLRRSEACSLRWDDIDFDPGSVIVRKGKGGKYRVVGIGTTARRALLRLPRNAHYVLNLRPAGLRMLLDRVGARAGVKVSPHALRRTMATQATKNGLSPFILQRLLGHSSITTTLLYVSLDDRDLLEAHRRASPVDTLRHGSGVSLGPS